MRSSPLTKDEWIALILLPFKTCVVVPFPLAWSLSAIFDDPDWLNESIAFFFLSSPFLFLGSMIQFALCKKRHDSYVTLGFAAVPPLVWLYIAYGDRLRHLW
jgi:hypothetical protein